jgi:hypothetical protein
MKFHVTIDAQDLLELEYTGNTSVSIGSQFMSKSDREAPSLYTKPGELRALAQHFDQLASWAGE